MNFSRSSITQVSSHGTATPLCWYRSINCYLCRDARLLPMSWVCTTGRSADFYERETESEITTLTALIEPIIIIGLGVIVAFILAAMCLPLFELVGTV
ncbi:MAG: type II secretion system F family protein [candidate division Zixibacteria bacterium]|nr:type II secretion system F family protein [candidate division Zixibacteria bacterium]